LEGGNDVLNVVCGITVGFLLYSCDDFVDFFEQASLCVVVMIQYISSKVMVV
jgi:hypothetical protein